MNVRFVNMTAVDTSGVIAGMGEMGDRLREARKLKFTSAAKAAAALGLKTSTYAAHENGQNEFDAESAKRYARRFGVSVAWLLTGDGEPQRVPVGQEFAEDGDPDGIATIGSETGARGIPPDASGQLDVTAGMGAGGMTIVSEGVPGKRGMTFAAENVSDYWRLPNGVVTSLGLRPHDVVVIPVQGDSMGETLIEGDFVFVDTRHRVPSPDGVYALADEFGGIVVKRLEVASGPRDQQVIIRVISDNPKHAPKERALDDIQIIGRVLRRFGVVS